MHEILSKQTHTISPTNLHDLLTLATNGDVRARMVYASHILVGTYIDHPVVQAFTKEILSREFKDLAPERYLPPPDQLRCVRFLPGSFLDCCSDGTTLYQQYLTDQAPLKMRFTPATPDLDRLEIDKESSIASALDTLDRATPPQMNYHYPVNDLIVALDVGGHRDVLQFHTPLPQHITHYPPLANAARSATRSILHLCLAANIVCVGCNKLVLPDVVLKKMLLHDGPRIEQDPWHVLAVPLYQKCRELNDQMGVEVLASLNPTRLSQVLTAKNPLEQGLKLIKKELEKLDKQVKQQQGMQERRENIARQVLFPPDLLDEIIPILTSVLKSPSSRYKRFDDGEISRLCLDVLERVAGLPTEELQAEKCEKWIAQLEQGHRTGELR